jgi:predicted ATP-binding protein involved in virulence
MQVKRLQINAFRGIEALDLEFHPGANVLIGVNGVGKSSILECLAPFVLYYTDSLGKTSPIPFPFTEESIKLNHNASSNRITYVVSGNRLLSWELNFERDKPEEIGLTLSASIQPSDATLLDTIEQLRKRQNIAPETTNVPVGIYYPTKRDIPQKLFLSELKPKNPTSQPSLNTQALEGRLDFTEFFTWFKEREDLENETRLETNPDHRDRQLEAIRNAIPVFLPGFSHLRIKRSPLRMVVTKNGQELIISQLSDGEKSLLTIIGDIARRLAICNPALENPLEGEGIILIDEIDAHLHPKWQRGIVPKLERTFPNCQFFIATHSPQIISDVRSENIYLLQQDADGEVIAVHPEGTYGRDTNQILEDVMGVPERPEWTKQELRQLFRLIDSGDLTAARDLKTQLEHRIGPDEPKFARADVLIRRKEILGR